MPPQERNPRKGRLDEALRTPRRAKAQPEYLAGGIRLPGQGKRGTTRPDYSAPRSGATGRKLRTHYDLKSHNLNLKSPSQALAIARQHTNKAVSDAQKLPAGEFIVIRYGTRPVDEVGNHEALEHDMNAIHFRPGSPVVEVHYGTVTYQNPNLEPGFKGAP